MRVHGDDISLLRDLSREEVQDEVQPMPAGDHRLCAAPRLDPEALGNPPRYVLIEGRRPRVACLSGHCSERSRAASGPLEP
jgi:hypothetical protein